MGEDQEDLNEVLARARDSQRARDPGRERHVRSEVQELIDAGKITEDDVTGNKLHYRLKVFGEPFQYGEHANRVRLPDWVDGLGADVDALSFIYTGGPLDRFGYRRCSANVGNDHTPKLLLDLVRDGQIDLAQTAFAGVVAEAWSFGEPFISGVDPNTWVSLFRLNGFAHLEYRPSEPLHLFRGTTEERKRGLSWTTDIDVARRFAYDRISSRPVGNVYTALIEPDWLLAYVNEGHSEKEWVVDPSQLRDDALTLCEVADDDPRPRPRGGR